MDLEAIQSRLREVGLDGWLFYDHHRRDPIAYRILGLPGDRMATRRWYCFVPAEGPPRKLCHAIEGGALDEVPGVRELYVGWREQREKLTALLGGARRVAMQWSPNNDVPYVSLVDGGTIDLVRSLGVEVASSADLVAAFEAKLDDAGLRSHREALAALHRCLDRTWPEIARRVRDDGEVGEWEIQEHMLDSFREDGMVWPDGPPIVAVGPHSGDPHYTPSPTSSAPIRAGDFVLLDLWVRRPDEGAIFADITWTGFVGTEVPRPIVEIFDVVRRARDRAVEHLAERFAAGASASGADADDACRKVVEEAGYGDRFLHRTGHSIGESVHGNGPNLDNLETRDSRLLSPGCLFSVEPGIYLEAFGVRSEIDARVTAEGTIEVTGPRQEAVVRIV